MKRDLFAKLGVCPEETILASNTSTLSITEIASGCGREDRVVGGILSTGAVDEVDRDVSG